MYAIIIKCSYNKRFCLLETRREWEEGGKKAVLIRRKGDVIKRHTTRRRTQKAQVGC